MRIFELASPPACIIILAPCLTLLATCFAFFTLPFTFTFHLSIHFTFALHCPVITSCHVHTHFDMHFDRSTLTAQVINFHLLNFSLTFTLPFLEIPMPPRIPFHPYHAT